jgi:GTPase SAR1 family protein
MDYVQGAAGYLLVVDSTRRSSLEAAHALQQKVEHAIGRLPFVLVLNKSDLDESWEKQDREIQQFRDRGWRVFETSAKTGTGVEEVFHTLAQMILAPTGQPSLDT